MRAASVSALAIVVLAGCTAEDGGDTSASADSSPTPSAGVQQPLNPTQVPPIETKPPVAPTNEPGRQDSVLDSLPGKEDAGCVQVEDARDVRSETMAAGNFVDARAQFKESAKSEIPFYFIPAALEDDAELVIRLTQVGGSGEDEIRSSVVEMADQWQYFPMRFAIPSAGTWRIEATAGANSSGCWEVAFVD